LGRHRYFSFLRNILAYPFSFGNYTLKVYTTEEELKQGEGVLKERYGVDVSQLPE
jgi:hypothetical protein